MLKRSSFPASTHNLRPHDYQQFFAAMRRTRGALLRSVSTTTTSRQQCCSLSNHNHIVQQQHPFHPKTTGIIANSTSNAVIQACSNRHYDHYSKQQQGGNDGKGNKNKNVGSGQDVKKKNTTTKSNSQQQATLPPRKKVDAATPSPSQQQPPPRRRNKPSFALHRTLLDSSGHVLWRPTLVPGADTSTATATNNEDDLPTLYATALLDPTAYLKRRKASRVGPDAARRLLHGKRDLVQLLQYITTVAAPRPNSKVTSAVRVAGHGVPRQVWEHMLDTARGIVEQQQSASTTNPQVTGVWWTHDRKRQRSAPTRPPPRLPSWNQWGAWAVDQGLEGWIVMENGAADPRLPRWQPMLLEDSRCYDTHDMRLIWTVLNRIALQLGWVVLRRTTLRHQPPEFWKAEFNSSGSNSATAPMATSRTSGRTEEENTTSQSARTQTTNTPTPLVYLEWQKESATAVVEGRGVQVRFTILFASREGQVL